MTDQQGPGAPEAEPDDEAPTDPQPDGEQDPTGPRASEFEPPPVTGLTGRHVRLRPVNPMDYEALYALSTRPDVTFRWRTRGNTPSPDAFAQALWRDTLVNFVVESPEGGPILGLVAADGAQFRDGFAHITMVAEPHWFRSGIILEGGALLIDYLFRMYPFRKLYMESVEFNFEHLKAGTDRLFVIEGCLRSHAWYHDRYWDQYLLALYREQWAELRSQLAWILTPPEEAPSPGDGPQAAPSDDGTAPDAAATGLNDSETADAAADASETSLGG